MDEDNRRGVNSLLEWLILIGTLTLVSCGMSVFMG